MEVSNRQDFDNFVISIGNQTFERPYSGVIPIEYLDPRPLGCGLRPRLSHGTLFPGGARRPAVRDRRRSLVAPIRCRRDHRRSGRLLIEHPSRVSTSHPGPIRLPHSPPHARRPAGDPPPGLLLFREPPDEMGRHLSQHLLVERQDSLSSQHARWIGFVIKVAELIRRRRSPLRTTWCG